MQGFDRERALTTKQACARMRGRGGKRMHPDTFRRLARHGVRLPSGEMLKVKAVRIGGEWLTMPEWLDAFTEARLLGGLPR